MEKEDAVKYSLIVLVFVALAGILLVLKPAPTGYAIAELEGTYENAIDCATAGGWWYNYNEEGEKCFDLSAVDTSENCSVLGAFWSEDSLTCEVLSCSNDLDLCNNAEDCETAGGVWNVDTCEACVPEESPITCADWVCGTKVNNCGVEVACGSCEGEQTCEEGVCICAQDSDCIYLNGDCGYGICNPTTQACEQAYNSSTDVCREAPGECDVEEFCAGNSISCPADGFKVDDTECSSGICLSGSCCELNTCSDLEKECGSGWDDGCGGTVDCGSCDSGYECSSGSCVEEDSSSDDSSSSESSSEEETSDKNLELSGQNKILVNSGSSEEATVHIVNVGKYYLNCKVAGDWMSSEEEIMFNKGEEVDVKYLVSVPEGTEAGDYSKELIIECNAGIRESEIIDVTVVGGPGITGDVVSEEEVGAKPGITGFVVGEGNGRYIAYVVFLLLLAGAVVLVWRRHGQIRGFDAFMLRGRNWFSNFSGNLKSRFHREQ